MSQNLTNKIQVTKVQALLISCAGALALLIVLLTRIVGTVDAAVTVGSQGSLLPLADINAATYISATILQEDTGTGLIDIVPQNSDWAFGRIFVLKDDDTYYLWLNNKVDTPGARVAVEQRLESQDGIVWTNRLDTNLVDTTYDYHVLKGFHHIIKDNGIYEGWESYYYNIVSPYMWVPGIRYITSTDGLTWDIVNQPALINGKHASLHKEDGDYIMWVAPAGDSNYTGSQEMRYRTSSLPGTGWGDWATGGTLIRVDGETVTEQNHVRKLADGTFQIFYVTSENRIDLAAGMDGITFTIIRNDVVDLPAILPNFASLRDFVVVDLAGEDWFYFSYLDTSSNYFLALARPERAVSGLVAENDSPTVLGQTTTLTSTITSGTSVSYTWDFGDGESGIGKDLTHIYPSVGIYTATVIASNILNTISATTTVVVGEVINSLTATSDSPTFIGQMTNLTATISSGTAVQYTWDFGDGSSGMGKILTHTYPAVGLYTAVVTAQNSFNILTATTDVLINPYNNFVPLITKDYCSPSSAPVDVILAMDSSGSMGAVTDDGTQTKLNAAKSAASSFISLLNFPADQAGIVSFSDNAYLNAPLTVDEDDLNNTLSLLTADGATRIDLAIDVSRVELVGTRHRPENRQVLILLSDGHPTETTEEAVLEMANTAKASSIIIYTIGLAQDVNESLMQEIASSPQNYYFAPSTEDLTAIYEQIADVIRCP